MMLEMRKMALLCSEGDLNPILGFCFPLFSMVFPGEFPSGEKTAEGSGSESVANCRKSTYIIFGSFKHVYSLSSAAEPQDNAFLSARHSFAPT